MLRIPWRLLLKNVISFWLASPSSFWLFSGKPLQSQPAVSPLMTITANSMNWLKLRAKKQLKNSVKSATTRTICLSPKGTRPNIAVSSATKWAPLKAYAPEDNVISPFRKLLAKRTEPAKAAHLAPKHLFSGA